MIVTDAWYPQINGVVRTLTRTKEHLIQMGHDVELVTPEDFRTFPCPTYPEIRLSIFPGRKVAGKIRAFAPDALHIATEGPLGLAARKFATRNELKFTTAYHTRFPEYVQARVYLPLGVTYRFLRWFHGGSQAVMAPTKTVVDDLKKWSIKNPVLWPRGVDLELFKPDPSKSNLPTEKGNPVFIYVGRVAVEKNLAEFLKLDLPGEKHVVGDGPAMKQLKTRFPDTVFHGAKDMEVLPAFYSKADVFVFPSLTDTFGLVLLEAMACGVPVAAYPVTGPLDVVGDSGAGVLDEDLKKACIAALQIDRDLVRGHAETFSWRAATERFEKHLYPARTDHDGYHISENPYKDNHGLMRAIAAARNSFAGIQYALREESAFRQELILAAVLVPLAFWMPASIGERLIMLAAVFLVLIVELLNSSVEAAIDRISYAHHGLSKRAKDYGSAAVGVALIFCGGTYAAFLGRWLISG